MYICCALVGAIKDSATLICEITLFSMQQYQEMTWKYYNIFDTYLLGDSGVRGAVGVDSKTRLFPFCWLLVYPFCNGCRFTMLPLSSTSSSKNRYLQTTFPHKRTTYFSQALSMNLFFANTVSMPCCVLPSNRLNLIISSKTVFFEPHKTTRVYT
jgi:hypothetical protein